MSVVISGHRNEHEAFDDDLKSATLRLYAQSLPYTGKKKWVFFCRDQA